MARVSKIKGIVVAEKKDGPLSWFLSRPEQKDDDGSLTVTPAINGRILNSESVTIPAFVLDVVNATLPDYPGK